MYFLCSLQVQSHTNCPTISQNQQPHISANYNESTGLVDVQLQIPFNVNHSYVINTTQGYSNADAPLTQQLLPQDLGGHCFGNFSSMQQNAKWRYQIRSCNVVQYSASIPISFFALSQVSDQNTMATTLVTLQETDFPLRTFNVTVVSSIETDPLAYLMNFQSEFVIDHG